MKQKLKKLLSSVLACAILFSSLLNAAPIFAANGVEGNGADISGNLGAAIGPIGADAPLDPNAINEVPAFSFQELGSGAAAALQAAQSSRLAIPAAEGALPSDSQSLLIRTTPAIGNDFLTQKPANGAASLRSQDNSYQFNPKDEIHEQGGTPSAFSQIRATAAAKFSPAAIEELFGAGARNKGSPSIDGVSSAASAFSILHPQRRLPPGAEAILNKHGFTIVPDKKVRLKLAPGVKIVKTQKRSQASQAVARLFHLAKDQVLADGSTPIALDGINLSSYNLKDPNDLERATAAIDAAIRKVVDANPARYNAPNGSADMWSTPIMIAPAVLGAPSIYANFRQVERGTYPDGKKHFRVVNPDGNMRFQLKVFKGIPYIYGYEGDFNSIDSKILDSRYTDDDMSPELINLVQSQFASASVDRNSAKAKKTSGQSSRAKLLMKATAKSEPAQQQNITFIDRVIMPDGKTPETTFERVMNIYQGFDRDGNEAIVTVDLHTGEAFPHASEDMRQWLPKPKEKLIPTIKTQQKKTQPPTTTSRINAGGLVLSHALVSSKSSANSDADAIMGTLVGRGNTSPDGLDNGPVGEMPLAYVYLLDKDGNIVAQTDLNGRFTVPSRYITGDSIELTFSLNGAYSPVQDADAKDAKLTQTIIVKRGQKDLTVTLNPKQPGQDDDQKLIDVINDLVYTYSHINWFKTGLAALGMSDPLIDVAIRKIVGNSVEMIMNAFYNPADLTLNLMEPGTIQQKVKGRDGRIHTAFITGEGTGQRSVIGHEETHSWVNIKSQLLLTEAQQSDAEFKYVLNIVDPIMGSDTNESTADIGSTLDRNNPDLGNGFIKEIRLDNPKTGKTLPLPNPNDIRNASNKDAYKPFDPTDPEADPHDGVLMELVWGVYQDLIPLLKNKVLPELIPTPNNEALLEAFPMFKDFAYLAAFRHGLVNILNNQSASEASGANAMIIDGIQEDGSNLLAPLVVNRAQNDHGLVISGVVPTPPTSATTESADASKKRPRKQPRKKQPRKGTSPRRA